MQPHLLLNFAPGQVVVSSELLDFTEILLLLRKGLPIMADDKKKGRPKKGSGKSKQGNSSDSMGKQKFSTDNPSTACEPEPACLTTQKLVSRLLPSDPGVDPSEALAGLSTERHSVGPFQGQDDSSESNTQAGDSPIGR